MPAQTYVIPNDKLTVYLLNPQHKKNGGKAKFFLARGFTTLNLAVIVTALFEHAEKHWPGQVYPDPPWGNLFELIGEINCPDGTTPHVLAVWKIERGQSVASFVTAYPYQIGKPHP